MALIPIEWYRFDHLNLLENFTSTLKTRISRSRTLFVFGDHFELRNEVKNF